ncbi:monocarboxylate transporter 9-like [Amblyomma americanum]
MMLHIFINQHFEKYKGLALGIMYTGCTVSAFVFPRLLLFLASTYGFRGSMLIFGAITMHGTDLTWMLKMSESNQVSDLRPKTTSAEKKVGPIENKAESIRRSLNEKEGSNMRSFGQNKKGVVYDLTVLRTPMFYVILLTYLVLNFTFGVFMTTVVDVVIDRSTSITDAVSLVPLFSITDTLGPLGLPVLADRGYLKRSALMMFNYLAMGICLFSLPFTGSYGTMLAVCMLVALFLGCGLPMYPALMAEYIGLERLPIAYGFVGTTAGPLFLLNPFFIGYFRDNVGSYDSMYKTLAAALMLFGATWMAVVCVERKTRREWHLKQQEPHNVHTAGSCTFGMRNNSYQF